MKLVIISSHGFSVHEGTQIHLMADLARLLDAGGACYGYLYNNEGRLIYTRETKFNNPVKELEQCSL